MPLDDFSTLKFLGKGNYGSVNCVKRKQDNKIYAMKEITIKYLSPREREDSVNEIRVLASFKHPNIVRYREAFIANDKLYIITEFAEDGDLSVKIRNAKREGKQFSENVIWAYFLQACKALAFLHQQNVIHRDIKTANIFVAKGRVIKLGDLGVAKVLHGKDQLARSVIGTPYYLSPEIWQNHPYNTMSDIWSLGCVLYELCTLRVPFNGSTMAALAKAVKMGQYSSIPSVYSKDLSRIISMCLSVDAAKRPTAAQLLNLPICVQKMAETREMLHAIRLEEFEREYPQIRQREHRVSPISMSQTTPQQTPRGQFALKSTIKIPRVWGTRMNSIKLPPSSYESPIKVRQPATERPHQADHVAVNSTHPPSTSRENPVRQLSRSPSLPNLRNAREINELGSSPPFSRVQAVINSPCPSILPPLNPFTSQQPRQKPYHPQPPNEGPRIVQHDPRHVHFKQPQYNPSHDENDPLWALNHPPNRIGNNKQKGAVEPNPYRLNPLSKDKGAPYYGRKKSKW
ncbi:putative G2-specific protein kinase nimA [Blattamonas nauphoetae]|uniref:non-specific serine/threonine protein kinase n=1 Tax=Blattamonas nauphoetae TaxID=2049346 RepID=A0ABQ9X3M6_9EUKA|nr:putative G2-specific protein kinase nimA [Blattamonas nauphoetae]